VEKKEHAKWNTAIEYFRAEHKAFGKGEYDSDHFLSGYGFSVEENQVEITFNDVVWWFLIRSVFNTYSPFADFEEKTSSQR